MDSTTIFVKTLELARKASAHGEIPVGAVVALNGSIIGEGFNMIETKRCQTYHAEVIAIQNACVTVGNWRLNNCDLFVTLEPCTMCAGLIELSRISRVHFLLPEPRFGFKTAHGLRVTFECYQFHTDLGYSEILKDFFQVIRKSKSG